MTIWIYTDADNTLWDTDAVFAQAQVELLNFAEQAVAAHGPEVDRLAFVRQFDQAIAARHHQGLRYPPALLFRALAEGIKGSSPDAAAQRALAEGALATEREAVGLSVYAEILAGVPPILDGVRAGLGMAHRHQVPLYVVSEGPLEVLRTRIQAHDLDRLISSTLSARKTPELYMRLRERAAPCSAVMIGDQPDRDIRFAREAGLQTVLVQGRFRPRWIQSNDISYASAVVPDFLAAVQWAMEANARSQG